MKYLEGGKKVQIDVDIQDETESSGYQDDGSGFDIRTYREKVLDYVNVDKSKIEHVLIKRILDYKSLLDVKLTARVTKEFYKEQEESFVLVSSDSDFWG